MDDKTIGIILSIAAIVGVFQIMSPGPKENRSHSSTIRGGRISRKNMRQKTKSRK